MELSDWEIMNVESDCEYSEVEVLVCGDGFKVSPFVRDQAVSFCVLNESWTDFPPKQKIQRRKRKPKRNHERQRRPSNPNIKKTMNLNFKGKLSVFVLICCYAVYIMITGCACFINMGKLIWTGIVSCNYDTIPIISSSLKLIQNQLLIQKIDEDIYNLEPRLSSFFPWHHVKAKGKLREFLQSLQKTKKCLEKLEKTHKKAVQKLSQSLDDIHTLLFNKNRIFLQANINIELDCLELLYKNQKEKMLTISNEVLKQLQDTQKTYIVLYDAVCWGCDSNQSQEKTWAVFVQNMNISSEKIIQIRDQIHYFEEQTKKYIFRLDEGSFKWQDYHEWIKKKRK